MIQICILVRRDDIDLGVNVGSDCSRNFTTDYTIQDQEVADKVFNRGLVGRGRSGK